jgi:MFS family permease
VLTLINLLNYLDRYVLATLLTDLKRAHMGLSDERLGLLMSGFLIVYMVAAPVFGAIGDRGSRVRPIAIGVLIWSIATGLSGVARNYLQLLAARAVVGIGEAAYGTLAPALLSDYFPRASRGRVLAVFSMAIPVGAALGYVVGGLTNQAYGWRAAFFVAGAPGLLLGLIVFGLPDPARRARWNKPAHAVQRRGMGVVYRELLQNAPYRLTVLGYAAYTFGIGGLAYWMPTFLQQVRSVPAAQASTGFGAIVVVTGFIGTLAGGWLGDYGLRYSREAYWWLSAGVTLLAAPLAALALAHPDPQVYYPAIVGAELLLFMSAGPINSAIINVVPAETRATAIALSVFAIHLLGDVPSPWLIGRLSDGYSLGRAVLVVPVAIVLSGGLWLLAGAAARRPQSVAATV